VTIRLYMDHHVPRAITQALRVRGVDILTAFEDGADRFSDAQLLDRAKELERILFTQDDDFLVEAARRIEKQQPFSGVIYAHQMRVSIGACIQQLEIIAKAGEEGDMLNQVEFLTV
jgi:predicted nuclease of predicted toxin-antitoxin system